jgi:2-methylcitrate dehydratase PrpD
MALLDWLACASRGAEEPAALAAGQAADGLGGIVTWLGTAGHVLDFDDTYLPGLSHLSAAVAPAALGVAAAGGRTVGAMLDAYTAGVAAMAALTRASHPALYDGGWHPTAVAGGFGAAIAAARLLGANERDAGALALLRAAGLRAAFGTDGKALQVGMAAADGVQAAQLVAAGARIDAARIEDAPDGFAGAFRATFPHDAPATGDGSTANQPGNGTAVFADLWIKAWPCCLQTHGAIEAALHARDTVAPGDALTVVVHPVSRRAAALDDVADGLQAKFSIPYLTAWTLRHGAPGLDAFTRADDATRADARAIRVVTDPALLESEAILERDGTRIARVEAALGSPAQPMSAEQLGAKIRALAGDRLDGILDDEARATSTVLAALRPPTPDATGGRPRVAR